MAVLLAPAVAALISMPRAAAAVSPFPIVAHMPVSAHAANKPGGSTDPGGGSDFAQSVLLLDVPARVGYQIVAWYTGSFPLVASTEITEFNLDNQSVVRTVELPGLLPADSGTSVGWATASTTFVAALAPASSGDPRLFFIADPNSLTMPGIGAHDLVTVDLNSMAVLHDTPIHSSTQQCENQGLATGVCPTFGLSYDLASGLVYATSADSNVAPGFLGEQKWSLSVRAVNTDTATYASAALPAACDAPLGSGPGGGSDPTPVFRSPGGSTLWTACRVGATTTSNSGAVSSAVAVPLLATGLPDSSQGAAVYGVTGQSIDAIGDPAGNRIDFVDTVNGDHNLVVFDCTHAAVVGVVGLAPQVNFANGRVNPQNENFGLDPATGRVYAAAETGIFLVDARRTDRQGMPQGTIEPLDAVAKYAFSAIAVDPATHDVYVREAFNSIDAPALGVSGGNGDYLDTSYTVYQDTVPVSSDISLSGLDNNTANVPLVPGSTIAIYSGHAQGFGSRTFSFNPNFVGGGINQGTGPVGGVRDTLYAAATTVAGKSSGADLSNNSASAVGLTSDADATTKSAAGSAYPYASHACNDSSGTKTTAASTNEPGGSTQESCDLTNGVAAVTSSFRSSDATGGTVPSTAPNESDISVTVNYQSGQSTSIGSVPAVVTTATATVQGIDLAANVSIQYLQVTATSVAGGRAGTASTTITRTIRGVQAGTFSCPTNCDPTQSLQAINSTLQADAPNQEYVVFPSADPAAAAGTPLGYYAAVDKNTYEFLNDSTLDSNSRPELVGLELVKNNDALFVGSTSRQITDYAGVEVESRFGITPLTLTNPTAGVGPVTSTAGVATIAGTAGTAGTPTTPGTPGTPASPGQLVANPASSVGGSSSGGSPGGPAGVVQTVLKGLEALLDWGQLPLMSLMWMVLLAPAILAIRRKRLQVLGL